MKVPENEQNQGQKFSDSHYSLEGNSLYFVEDYQRNTGEQWKKSFRQCMNVLFNHGLLYLFVYRKWQKSSRNYIWRGLRRRIGRRYGLEIDSKNIGAGFRLVHPYNITISPLAKLGGELHFT